MNRQTQTSNHRERRLILPFCWLSGPSGAGFAWLMESGCLAYHLVPCWVPSNAYQHTRQSPQWAFDLQWRAGRMEEKFRIDRVGWADRIFFGIKHQVECDGCDAEWHPFDVDSYVWKDQQKAAVHRKNNLPLPQGRVQMSGITSSTHQDILFIKHSSQAKSYLP